MLNEVNVKIKGILENIALVRVIVASVLAKTNITLDELSDIKTAVSEAVSNAIEHGYNMEQKGDVDICIKLGELDSMIYFWIKVIE